MDKHKPSILVLCTGNSCRSQMAEAFLRKHAGDRFVIYSAGTVARGDIHPMARQVMAEIGLDMAGQYPKSVQTYLGRITIRYLMVVCARAEQQCPHIFPGALNRMYWPFDDPAQAQGSEEQRLTVFRRVRDEIETRVCQWLELCGETEVKSA